MEKEKSDKFKKKKTIKKEDENKIRVKEKVLEDPACMMNTDGYQKKDQANTALFLSEHEKIRAEGNQSKIQNILQQRGRNKSVDFYTAHPRDIKQIARFSDVHSRKLSELLEAFHIFDFDRDGVISHDDLKKTFSSLCADIGEEEIDQMLSEGSDPLNFDAFVILLGYKTLELDPEEVLLAAFSNWDDHQEGLISYERLKHHMLTWSDRFTEDEAVEALADAPIVLNKTKEKMIDYIQFSEDLCGLRKIMQRKTNERENSVPLNI